MNVDPRRLIPRTDELLAYPAKVADHIKRKIVAETQQAARRGELEPAQVGEEVRRRFAEASPYSLRPILNCTGVIVHTNLGRAPLSAAATQALVDAAGYTDVELDLAEGTRSQQRGKSAVEALLAACPGAEDALVVNNGAAALLLACAALADAREVVVSRGELIEIGAGFRLPELIESAHVRLREVGATNRTHLADYLGAINSATGAILKVHPSNFRVVGFTSAVSVAQLRESLDELQSPPALIVDLGSGLLNADPTLPDEPDLQAQLANGADVVIASGDKLLGGPQAGILLGKKDALSKIKRHPLARAVRIDKLRLNALEAAVSEPSNAVADALHIDAEILRKRTEAIAHAVGAHVVEHAGRVGGGGAPEYPLTGCAVCLPEALAPLLRQGRVMPRVHGGACLVDVRCVPESEDGAVIAAIKSAQVIAGEGKR